MNNIIDIKRESLESFIREQMIGPNGCRGRFSIEMEEGQSFDGEVINTTPGSIYSTAVLFPPKAQGMFASQESSDEADIDDETVSTNGQEDDDELLRTDSNEQNGDLGNEVDDEDVYSLSRRFPNTVGISCCLVPEASLSKDVEITVSGRYYTKIVRGDKQRVQVLVSDHLTQFEQFFKENPILHQYFNYNDGKLKIYPIPNKNVSQVKDMLRTMNMNCAAKLAVIDGETDPIFTQIPPNYRFLLSYREVLFNKYLNHIHYEKDSDDHDIPLYLTDEEKQRVLNQLEKVEMYETFLSYFDNLIELYDHKGFGFWQSHDFSTTLNLEGIKSESSNVAKQIFKPKDNDTLNHFYSVDLEDGKNIALSAWLQVTRNSKDKTDRNQYLKVLIVNDSSPFRESPKNYFSIVNEEVNKLCFFGIHIDLKSKFLCPYHEGNTYKDVKKDEDKLNFLYRSINDYGVGHLCSVDWKKDEDGKVYHIWSEFIPSFETPDIEPVPRKKYSEYIEKGDMIIPQPYFTDDRCLQFKYLSTFSEANDPEIISGLKDFIGLYEDWIAQNEARIKDVNDRVFALDNLSKCKSDMQRMKDNVDNILSSNKENMRCFRLMNSAMFMQLWHNKKDNQKIIIDDDPNLNENFYKQAQDNIFTSSPHAAWRPFQLAFILLNLDGIINHPQDNGWKKRNDLVDLVWFPTGGGKTEAYLGIIALCIIYRRRVYGEQGYGVAAIMRYTLRLLTTQQFQRALRLILALEQMRRWGKKKEEFDLGAKPISIGLYVGSNSLPNIVDGKDGLDDESIKWDRREDGENKTKIPLDRCPWCGSKLRYSQKKKLYFCSNANDTCTFSDELPVRLCDEHIYKEPPTLLFGTVDKFAAIAHRVSTKPKEENKDSRRIFGQGINCLPPDLIIQDELHLLLGPLGSAVSLFECAIDQLCTRKDGTRPKIISSTATTRNTDLQIRALYDRDLNIFPHNGVDYDDSFFAFYKREKKDGQEKYISKRKYIGIMPTGRTQMTTQMRLAAILLVHRAIFEAEHSQDSGFEFAANNYYSVISYFNSLKEVGKTDALFYTEYSKYVRRLFKRVMPYGNLLECFYSMNELSEAELSGRLTGAEVNEKFAEVGQNWSIEKRLPHKENGEWVKGSTPPDYILATNMISVGLDVGRFNTIIMNSMPRNIAEYIQASSRVAREQKGLVLTLHNPFRSRDVSHYEKFREFHEKLYFYVEPISITPFSKKSVEKYLALYLAAIVRHSYDKLADRNSASKINESNLSDQIKQMVADYFNQRYDRMQKPEISQLEKGLLTPELRDNIIRFVDEAIGQWEAKANEVDGLVYNSTQYKNAAALFNIPAGYDESNGDNLWTVPQSLRIVEPEAVLHIRVGNDGN